MHPKMFLQQRVMRDTSCWCYTSALPYTGPTCPEGSQACYTSGADTAGCSWWYLRYYLLHPDRWLLSAQPGSSGLHIFNDVRMSRTGPSSPQARSLPIELCIYAWTKMRFSIPPSLDLANFDIAWSFNYKSNQCWDRHLQSAEDSWQHT